MNNIQADELFKSIDLNNKGYITKEDINKIDFMTEEVFKKLDLNKDGQITLEEFRECFNENRFGNLERNERENEEDFCANPSNEESDEEDFQNMIHSLNAEKIVNEMPNVRFLWQYLRKKPEEQEKLKGFEELLNKLAKDQTNFESENTQLKKALSNEKANREYLLDQLQEETELQINETRSSLIYQENLKREKLQKELEETERELQEERDKRMKIELKLVELETQRLKEIKKLEKQEFKNEPINSLDNETIVALTIPQAIPQKIPQTVPQAIPQNIQNLAVKESESIKYPDLSDFHKLTKEVEESKIDEINVNVPVFDSKEESSQTNSAVTYQNTYKLKDISEDVKYKKAFKVVFLGDSGVGKTGYIKRIISNRFDHHISSTVGVDFVTKQIQIEDKVAHLKIWDTAGQERYRSIVKAYYRDADCVICMYDVTCEKSFHNLKNWIASIKDIKDNTTIKIVIIGTKVDLIENTNLKTVQTKEAEAFAEENQALFFQISSKTCLNVFESIEEIAKLLLKSSHYESDVERSGFTINENKPDKKSCCN